MTTLYYIMAVNEEGQSKVVGLYTGRAEFNDALEESPDSETLEYATGELAANMPVLSF